MSQPLPNPNNEWCDCEQAHPDTTDARLCVVCGFQRPICIICGGFEPCSHDFDKEGKGLDHTFSTMGAAQEQEERNQKH